MQMNTRKMCASTLDSVYMLALTRQVISKVGLPLVIDSLLWLSFQFYGQLAIENNAVAFLDRQGRGTMSMFNALDLVIAMPVSWLPLVADYARHGRNGKSTFVGVGLGYCLANIWCYVLGIMVISVASTNADMITSLLLAQGGLIALSFIVIDELDNAYGDLYCASISTSSILVQFKIKHLGMLLAIISIICALILPMHALEPFLLLLSSIFIPLFGVILGRSFFGHQINIASRAKKVELLPAALWLIGIIFYHTISYISPTLGSALPTLALTFAGGLLSKTTNCSKLS